MEVLHKSKRQIRKQVPQVLSLVGITDKAHKYPDELSAGEQQRVAIARAIINNPMVLIADEPTGNLDPITAAEIMDLLEQINMRGTYHSDGNSCKGHSRQNEKACHSHRKRQDNKRRRRHVRL